MRPSFLNWATIFLLIRILYWSESFERNIRLRMISQQIFQELIDDSITLKKVTAANSISAPNPLFGCDTLISKWYTNGSFGNKGIFVCSKESSSMLSTLFSPRGVGAKAIKDMSSSSNKNLSRQD
ncbi:hypothetical protein EPI10_011468 [Gossypium australe]|uniref:Uncharacterized protein n=1 Tax=Gossypium australe TaxID=47621 RepID=A0A5B6W6T7_9ROSI|nr:hypothetical protein EPI10_011468 [Gossypium australe]